MKYLFIPFFLIIINNYIFGQLFIDTTERPKHNISAGFLGDLSIYSLSYERYNVLGPKFILIGKAGLGYNEDFLTCIFDKDCISYNYVTIPTHASANFGNKRFFFELGMGSTFILGVKNTFLIIYPFAGLRLIPLKSNRISCRAFALLPISVGENKNILEFPLGVNVGFSF